MVCRTLIISLALLFLGCASGEKIEPPKIYIYDVSSGVFVRDVKGKDIIENTSHQANRFICMQPEEAKKLAKDIDLCKFVKDHLSEIE